VHTPARDAILRQQAIDSSFLTLKFQMVLIDSTPLSTPLSLSGPLRSVVLRTVALGSHKVIQFAEGSVNGRGGICPAPPVQ
jgi:hypothetical protein